MSIWGWLKSTFWPTPPEMVTVAAPAIEKKRRPAAPEGAQIRITAETVHPGACTHVLLDGMLNSTTADEFEIHLNHLINEGRVRLLIDFSGVPYVSSRGWGVLISLLKSVRKGGGDIKILGLRPNVVQLFWYAGLSNIFKTYSDKVQAAESFIQEK